VAKHEFGKVFSGKNSEEVKESRAAPEENSSEKKRRNNPDEEAKEEKAGYEEVVKSLRECLEERNPEEDEDFAEDESQRVKANFLTPEGAQLPGVCEIDSAFGRIEALRCYLESQLGIDRFIQAYAYLQV
jgi:hypothetical protein